MFPLALTDKGIARQGDPVYFKNSKVGLVTSGTMVPYWKFEGKEESMKITDEHDLRAIALVYIDSDIPYDQKLEVEVRGRRIHSQLVQNHGTSGISPYFHAINVKN